MRHYLTVLQKMKKKKERKKDFWGLIFYKGYEIFTIFTTFRNDKSTRKPHKSQ